MLRERVIAHAKSARHCARYDRLITQARRGAA
jgi:hypothetical protein